MQRAESAYEMEEVIGSKSIGWGASEVCGPDEYEELAFLLSIDMTPPHPRKKACDSICLRQSAFE